LSRIIPDLVVASQELPAQVDVVVIGGGIIGVSTALSLVERGVSVALCEKGLIGAEQTSRNWGWVRQMGRDPAELPLAIESLRIWRGMNERIGGETGFRQAGIAYLCDTDADVAMYEEWLKHAAALDLDSRLVRGEALKTLISGAAKPFRAALHTPARPPRGRISSPTARSVPSSDRRAG
jgi:glycine/D-amino acid oxidase-like deaminating enzyme